MIRFAACCLLAVGVVFLSGSFLVANDGCQECYEDCQLGDSCCMDSCCTDCCQSSAFFVETWLDQGFTGNTASPADRFNGPLLFTDRANEYQMNQLYLALGRNVDKNGCGWDIGGRVDLLYGSDYYFTMATGLETHRDGTPKWNGGTGPRGTGAALYGLAMPQLYAEVFAPIGNGLTVKMGHFYTILGYESVMAPYNFFYTHSYSMMYGEPFTHTGMLAEYDLSPNLKLQGGFTRSWDTWQGVENSLGFLGGITWTSTDKRTSVAFALDSGNEEVNGENNRTVYSLVLQRQLSNRWKYVFQHDLGVQDNGAVFGNHYVCGNWYSINQYLFYQYSDTTSFGVRAEWFYDHNSTRILTLPSNLVHGGNYAELTLGMNWKPNKHVILRPELRCDWSDVNAPALGVNGVYDDFTKKNQFLLAVDLILRH